MSFVFLSTIAIVHNKLVSSILFIALIIFVVADTM